MSKVFKGSVIYSFLIIIFISIFLLFLCFVGKFFLSSKFQNEKENIITVDYLQDDDIQIYNTLPIADIVGKNMECSTKEKTSSKCLDFTIKSNVSRKVNYEIYLSKNDSSSEIRSEYIKLYLTEGENHKPMESFDTNIIPSYYSLRVSSKEPSAKILYSGVLDKNEEKSLQLRMFLADTYVMQTKDESFSVRLYVKVV